MIKLKLEGILTTWPGTKDAGKKIEKLSGNAIMSTQPQSLASRVLTKQWSFFWAGIGFGVAQVIYMITLWMGAWDKGKEAISVPITVTTDLGRMFRAMELQITQWLGMADLQIYGSSVDGVASGGAFVPGVGWPIVGMMIGGLLVAKLERESRSWVKYSTKMLWISFLGGILFSYGTRLAGGCTLNHLLGGLPMMNIHSTVTVIMMAVGGALAFVIMSKFNLADNFKHQETKSYVANADAGERSLYDPNYRPMGRPIYWVSLLFLVLFFGVAIYGGIFSPEGLEHLKKGEVAAFYKSVDHKGWFYVLGTLGAGIIGGFAMAKSGFGTECALVCAETAQTMTKNDAKFAGMHVPKITRTLMRGYLPMIGVAAHWVVMLAVIWGAWVFFDIAPGFDGSVKFSLTAGSIIGGLLLGMGAVLLIGCEIRSYMRIGLGYLNTWVGLMGFAVGYLPFTQYYDAHKAFLKSTILMDDYKWYQLVSDNIGVQQAVLGLWLLAIVALLVWLVRLGAHNTGTSQSDLLHKSTEELQLNIDAISAKNNGRVGEVAAPMPVPLMGNMNAQGA